MYKVNKEKCLGCGACASNCPEGMEMGHDNKAKVIDQKKLEGCGGESVCSVGAIEKISGESDDSQENSEENKDQNIEEIIKWYENYAEENGFKLNPDRTVVEGLIKGLLLNEEKYGERYCPCRIVTGNPEEDRDKICPCKWHKEEIERDGNCHCKLFFKK